MGLGYLQAEFADDVCLNDTNDTTPEPNCGGGNQLVQAGSELPFSPELTANAGVEYAVRLANGMTLTPRLQWSYLGSQLASPFPGPKTTMPSHDFFNAFVRLDVNDSWKVEGFVNNLTDETYIAAQVQDASSADGGYIYGPPRTYGVRTVFNF